MEGLTDKRILEQAFIDGGRADISVYAVNSAVDFSDSGFHPGNNNKARCIALAEFFLSCDAAHGKATCLVDADQDIYDETVIRNDFLLYTEHSDLTLYFAKEDVLKYSLQHILGDSIHPGNLIATISDACVEIFKVRRGVKALDNSIAFVEDVRGACDFDSAANVRLNTDRLIQQILNPVQRMDLALPLKKAAAETVTRTDISVTTQMCGHDFVQVLRGVLIKLGGRDFTGAITERFVETLLYAGQPAAQLCETRIVKEIFGRLSESV